MKQQGHQKLRIAHFIPSLGKGGAERLVIDMVRELSERPGVEVQLVSFSPDNEFSFLSKEIIPQIVPAKIIPSISRKPLINTERLDEFLDRFNPHIIHSHLFEADLICRWNIRPRTSYFLTAHSNTEEIKKPRIQDLLSRSGLTLYYDHRLIRRKLISNNDHIIAVSKDTRDYFLKNLPELASNIYYLPNAIHFESFRGDSKTGLQNNKPVKIISVGRLHSNKNHFLQLEIASLLKQHKVDFHLHILGEGELREEIENRIRSNSLEKVVSLCGNQNDVASFLRESHIFLHTAFTEAFGLVIVEAMACGLPVVCLDAGGNRDIMEDGSNGFMLKTPDAALFTEKIMKMINNSAMYEAMSIKALKTAAGFDIKDLCDKLLDLYNNALINKR